MGLRFLPSEEARLILGYLQSIGLEKCAQTFLDECDSLSEFRSVYRNFRNCVPHMLGLTLSNIFDFYYQHNYDTRKTQSRVEMVYSKATQTEDEVNSSFTKDDVIPFITKLVEDQMITLKSKGVADQIIYFKTDRVGDQMISPITKRVEDKIVPSKTNIVDDQVIMSKSSEFREEYIPSKSKGVGDQMLSPKSRGVEDQVICPRDKRVEHEMIPSNASLVGDEVISSRSRGVEDPIASLKSKGVAEQVISSVSNGVGGELVHSFSNGLEDNVIYSKGVEEGKGLGDVLSQPQGEVNQILPAELLVEAHPSPKDDYAIADGGAQWFNRAINQLDISQFLKSADTFDMSSRLGAGLCGVKRQSIQPQLFVYPEDSSFSIPNSTAPLPPETSGVLLNQILGIENSLQAIESKKGFSSPNPSPVTPRRISLLKCTPSPNKRFTGIVKHLSQSCAADNNPPIAPSPSSITPKRKSNPAPPPSATIIIPFAPPDKCAVNAPGGDSPAMALLPKKRRTSYQKKPAKRKTVGK